MHHIPSPVQLSPKHLHTWRTLNNFIKLLSDLSAYGRLAIVYSFPLGVVHLLMLRIVYNRKSIFTAQSIGNFTYLIVITLGR